MLLWTAYASTLARIGTLSLSLKFKPLLSVHWFNHGFLAGTKIVFWDLRGPFIDNLYKPSVPGSRMEALIEPLDVVMFALLNRGLFVWLLLDSL